MILNFVETSALIKLFIEEVGSQQMTDFLATSDDSQLIVAAIAHTESRSAICKLRRRGKLTEEQAASAMSELAAQILRLTVQPATSATFAIANDLVDRHDLRALDAVQLASAISARSDFKSSGMRFIASDRDLLSAARSEGFIIWDPAI